jgi:hypothetical protein
MSHSTDAEVVEPILRVHLSETQLRAEYDRICRRLLERTDETPEIPPGTTLEGTYDPRAIAMARENWRHRMRQEHHSGAVFSGMLPHMIAANSSIDLKMSALRCGLDELRHAALCAQVVELLGGRAEVAANLVVEPIAEHPGVPWREKVLRNLIFVGCISETVAVAVLTDEREHTREPAIARVLRQLAGDEALHARIGWIHLRDVWSTLDDAARARTNEYIGVALAYYERCILDAARPANFDPGLLREARALGFADGGECREIIYASLESVVIPQLDEIGLAATRAWNARSSAERVAAGPLTLVG